MHETEFYNEGGRHHEGEGDIASWRDDHYHDHSGFDLSPHRYETDHHGMRHEEVISEMREHEPSQHWESEHQTPYGGMGYLQ